MRVIKFRVWDKERKGFLHQIDIDSDIIYVDTRWYIHGGHALDDNYVMQQYTGMRDKGGTEIYEGDIVKGLFKDTDYNHWDEIKASVVYCDRFAGFSVGCENWVKQTIEVIGNIFENPELLK
jgi:uncharacterized phage protein (TIGR01671 family)